MDGIILINKEKQYTSHDVVAKLKKILNEKKVGHTGTLDPNATGVLPILLGNATKISKYLIEHDKEYEVVLKLGEKTSTGDAEGEVIETKDIDINEISIEKIKNVLNEFVGIITQIPPMYSAIKIKGKKLYEYARQGKIVEIPKREIEIYNIEFNKLDKENKLIYFKVECSKGTYIRTLCEDIADKLETVGYMNELKRIKVGRFTINNSVKIDDNNLESYVMPIEEIFKSIEKIELKEYELEGFLNGVLLSYCLENGLYKIYNGNIFVGLGIIEDKKLKRDVIV